MRRAVREKAGIMVVLLLDCPGDRKNTLSCSILFFSTFLRWGGGGCRREKCQKKVGGGKRGIREIILSGNVGFVTTQQQQHIKTFSVCFCRPPVWEFGVIADFPGCCGFDKRSHVVP